MKGRITGFAAAAALWLVCAALCASANAKDGGGDGMPGAGPGTQGEISGVVQTMPATGLVGDWKIAGRTVRTDAATQFDQGDGQVGVGAMVEVQGTSRLDGSLLAARMEVRMGVGQPPAPGSAPGSGAPDDGGPGEFVGPIITLPEGGLLGLWDVGGRKVSVVSTTRLDQAHGTIAVGAMVEVNGLPDRSGIVVAGSVEVRTAPSAVPPGEVPVPGKVELAGRIESLPAAGLIGNWQVGGRAVIVTAGTMLDPGHGAFIVGASVEAKGALDTEGALKATKVETTEGNGASEPALEFWGKVVALPTGTTGLIGVWKVDDRLVNVTAATRIEAKDVALAAGAAVQVTGWIQPDGMIEAGEIETRAMVGSLSAQGAKAIEFFNPALGHFFVTASPAEIVALDAAGAWQRTGQAFSVGSGSHAVCRFYGMPPKGPDSHFFTADPAECQSVMTKLAAWTFEGHAFSVTPPASGQCPPDLLAVHRFFNNPSKLGDINHRFTVSQQMFDQMHAQGWVHEGVVMCVQP